MSYKMFIDDERCPSFLERFGVVRCEYVDMVVCRSSFAAITQVIVNGMPDFISFDHDLGGDDTSRHFINWLVEQVGQGEITFPEDFDFFVHSQNPIGSDWIKTTMIWIINHSRNMKKEDI